MSFGDKIADFGFWVCAPTLMLTQDDPRKWVRVLGTLGVFLLPFWVAGSLILLTAAVVWVFEES